MTRTMLPIPVQSTRNAGPSSTIPTVHRQPILWLLVIVAVGLALRWGRINDSFQLDEFGPLYAIAERQTATPEMLPSASDPLVPVASLEEVRARSILPYGIVNPFPFYHYLLYDLIHVLPIT